MNHGTFVDCRSHWKGRFDTAAISLAKHAGGVLAIGADGDDRRTGLARTFVTLAARVRLQCTSEPDAPDHRQFVLLRQENDPAPKFHFLEEGCVRLGMRVAFDLLDDAGHYHGDGRQDIWLYPEGDAHITTNLQIVDRAGHGDITDAYLEVSGNGAQHRIEAGGQVITADSAAPSTGSGAAVASAGDSCGSNAPDRSHIGAGTGTIDSTVAVCGSDAAAPTLSLAFGDDLPDRRILLVGDDTTTAVYWARDAGHVWQVGSDHGSQPPFYASRWPTGMQQWARGGMGWTCHRDTPGVDPRGTGVRLGYGAGGPNLQFGWLRDSAVSAGTEAEATYTATLVVSTLPNTESAILEQRIAAVQQPLTPTVRGGTFRCYTEEDGTYEIGQGDPTGVSVTFPPDPLARSVRLRYFRRKTDPRHRGGIRVTADGAPAAFQCQSEGELTDDICVPMEMAHRQDSVDDVIVAAHLSPAADSVIRIDKVPGVQATYQSEITGVDLQRRAGNRRDVVLWSSANPEAPGLEFDLFSGAVHRLTGHGQTQPVVWEMPMAWFKSCGISPHHYCNWIKQFKVLNPGPEKIELYARSTNPNGRTQNETWLTVPWRPDHLRLEVRMRMQVLEQWDAENAEFTDIFPYPSRLPETWFHAAVLFVQRDRTQIKYSYRPDTSAGTSGDSDDPRLFYALYPSARGNVLTLIDNPQHPDLKLHHSVCGNYVDIHVHLRPEVVPVPAGTKYEIRYVCAVWGDERTTADELKRIGLRSLEAGDLVL